MDQILTLAIGDRVTYRAPDKKRKERTSLAFEGTRVVTDSSAATGAVKYGVNGCAWYSRENLVFVERATPDSLRLALSYPSDEDDEEL